MRFLFFGLLLGFGMFQGCNQQPTPLTANTVSVDQPLPDSVLHMLTGRSAPLDSYHAAPPIGRIRGVLVLLPGFSRLGNSVLEKSALVPAARRKGWLVIAAHTHLNISAHAYMRAYLSDVISDVQKIYRTKQVPLVIGGFSAGGVVALRYTEYCYHPRGDCPAQPQAVFNVDGPIDLFHLWSTLQRAVELETHPLAMQEAIFLERYFKQVFKGTPSDTPALYRDLTPFERNAPTLGNAQYLLTPRVYTFHDVDTAWYANERSTAPPHVNPTPALELIQRLQVAGHPEAHFINRPGTGYRTNGDRHPHSWSIVDVEFFLKELEELL